MNDPRHQGREANKQQDATATNLKNIKISIDALANQIEAQRRETKESDQHKWPKRTAIAAISYTILTAIIMIVSGYQTYLIRSNNVVSERAFVSAGFSAGPTAYDATPQKFTVQSVMDALTQGAEGLSSVNFVANLTNNGNTGTKGLTFFLKCAPSTEMLQDPWPLLYQGVNNAAKTPQYIGPHASAQTLCGFSGDQIRAIAAGRLFGYIMLDATYQDRLSDEKHRTETTVVLAHVDFVPAIQPNGSQGFSVATYLSAYGKHNCADEECPAD